MEHWCQGYSRPGARVYSDFVGCIRSGDLLEAVILDTTHVERGNVLCEVIGRGIGGSIHKSITCVSVLTASETVSVLTASQCPTSAHRGAFTSARATLETRTCVAPRRSCRPSGACGCGTGASWTRRGIATYARRTPRACRGNERVLMTVTEEQVMPLVTEGLAELRRIATLRQCGRMPSVLSVRRSQRRCEDSRKWNVREKLCCITMSLCTRCVLLAVSAVA